MIASKKTIILISTILMIFTLSGCTNKNTADNFQKLQVEGKKSEAEKVLKNLKDENEKKQSIDYLKEQIDKAYDDFANEKIDYDKASNLINDTTVYNVVNDKANETLKKLVILNNSRKAFNEAKKFEEKKDYSQALTEYSKVIKEDKYYDAAVNKVKEMEQKLVDSQEVVISNVRLGKDLINDNQLSLALTNKTSDKIVKVAVVSMLAYDKDGLPVKINMGYDKIFNGKAEKNIQPGKSSEELTWTTYADETTTQYKVCVKQVQYYDGSTWDNPLYQSWYDQFYDKPLNQ